MNVNATQSAPAVPQAVNIDQKRAMLQAQILRRSVDAQQEQSVAQAREAEGKGQLLDIRV